MINEKIYTQEDLNNAVTKAISDMEKVLNEYKKALDIACYDLLIKSKIKIGATEDWVNMYLTIAREENEQLWD